MKKLISRRNFLKVCALAGSAAALSACRRQIHRQQQFCCRSCGHDRCR